VIMGKERFKIVPASHLFLVQDGKILLSRRYQTGWMDGSYSVPAGHIDGDETARAAGAREGLEEAGIVIAQSDLQLAHVMHRNTADTNNERVDFFFVAKQWQGELKNAEPEKCDDLSWFALSQLPDSMVPYVRAAIDAYKQGIIYSEFGWQ
jgi:8-oxo-dGTP diphosphatase